LANIRRYKEGDFNLNNIFADAQKAVLKGLQNYTTFTGRASRSEFWYFLLFFYLANFLGNLITDILGTIISLALLLPYLAVGVRRMHDRNKSGWFLIVPLFNIYLLATVGDSGPNRFGPKPSKL
jgi:uncharacterized membrane protein YhaH (DUF805 family)